VLIHQFTDIHINNKKEKKKEAIFNMMRSYTTTPSSLEVEKKCPLVSAHQK
jgi:hypothetical protein